MDNDEVLTAENAENKGYFSEEDLRAEIREQFVDKIHEEFSVDLNSTAANDAIDRTVDWSIMDNLENVEKVDIDGETYYKSTEGLDLEDYAATELEKHDSSSIMESGILEHAYGEQYSISDSIVEDNGSFANKIVEFKDSDTESVSVGRNTFKFGEELTLINNSEFTTREEGIISALEAGVNINDLAEATSPAEVVEAAKESDRFEVVSENQFINDIQDQVSEKMKDEAAEMGITVSSEIEFGNVNDGGYSVGISELENSNIEGISILENPNESGDSSIIIETEIVNFEEVKESIANDVIEGNRESFESDLTNGKTFEEAVASDTNTPTDKLDNLADSEDWKIREAVAGNENTSTETLDKLSNDEDRDVRAAVAGNENTSTETLEKLSNDKNDDVREAASANLETKEVEIEGDHAKIKEQTMAGEESERVVNREAGLDELDKTAGKDSDKFETKEENAARDGLSSEEAKLLSSLEDKNEKTLADGIDAYNSNSKNSETSEKQGEHDSESVKQR